MTHKASSKRLRDLRHGVLLAEVDLPPVQVGGSVPVILPQCEKQQQAENIQMRRQMKRPKALPLKTGRSVEAGDAPGGDGCRQGR